MKSKALLIPLAVILVVLAAGIGVRYLTGDEDHSAITSYEQCVAAGYPVLKSYPPQCKLPDGRTFIQETGDAVPPPAPTSSPTGPATTTYPAGAISGYIHVGPTCAVQPAPPIEGCDDRPYANAPVAVTNKTSGAVAKTVSNENGNFRISLAAGTYTIRVSPESGRFPSCEIKEVAVVSGKTTAVDIGCDSGLR